MGGVIGWPGEETGCDLEMMKGVEGWGGMRQMKKKKKGCGGGDDGGGQIWGEIWFFS